MSNKGSVFEKVNKKPEIIPGIKEWCGACGYYALSSDSTLIYGDTSLARTLEIIAGQFKTVLGKNIYTEHSQRMPKCGDVEFKLDGTKFGELGEEGYLMEISDTVTVCAATKKGILYGGMTLVQMLYTSDALTAPKGSIKDYPQYPVRSVSLDIGRFWMPLDHVAEISKFLALYKVNEIHLHISDEGGELAFIGLPYYSTLRLESKRYPAVNVVPGQFYTQEEYRKYQKDVADFGVKVVTEIDAPAHCAWVHYVNSDYMYDSHHMKLDVPEARAFMKDILEEFLGGDDPVIVSDTFSIGCDEYSVVNDPERFTSYMNEMGQYVNKLGYKAQFWSNSRSSGGLSLEFDGIVNMWDYNDNPDFLNSSFGLINNDGPNLYIVPGKVSNWFYDHLDIATSYNFWEVNIFDAGKKHPTQIVDPSDPRLLGAEASIWCDTKVGASEFDYFDRIFDQIMLISEKCWYGAKAEGQTAVGFIGRIEKAPVVAYEANPARYVRSVGNDLVNIDFTSVNGNTAIDSSENGYNAILEDVEIGADGENRYAILNGGRISLPFASVGFPYYAAVTLCLYGAQSENAPLFDGKDGTMYLNFKGTGKLGYVRHDYEYIFDYTPPADKWFKIELLCDDKDLTLVADGMHVLAPHYTDSVSARKQFCSTFVLPTESIGGGVSGKISDIVIRTSPANAGLSAEFLVERNLAFGKPASASSCDEEKGHIANNVTDSIPTGNSRWAPNFDDINAELAVDLERVTEFNEVKIRFYGAVGSYELLASEDGVSYSEIFNVTDGPTLINIDIVHSFKTCRARYIKFVQLAGRENARGENRCSIKELEVRNAETADYSDVCRALENAEKLVANDCEKRDKLKELIASIDFGRKPWEQAVVNAYANYIKAAFPT